LAMLVAPPSHQGDHMMTLATLRGLIAAWE
jgi:hypothetical protein